MKKPFTIVYRVPSYSRWSHSEILSVTYRPCGCKVWHYKFGSSIDNSYCSLPPYHPHT